MTRSLDLTGPNKWQRIYFEQHQGNPANKKIRAPLIEPFELPFLLSNHVLAITTAARDARPKWRTAGYLTQTYPGISLELNSPIFTVGSPTAGIDAESVRIGLNIVQLVIFPKIANDFYLWFDPVPWLLNLTLGIWEFVGTEHDNIVELIETVKVDLARIESRLNSSN